MTSYVTKTDNKHSAMSADNGKKKEYFKNKTPISFVSDNTKTTANRSSKLI